ncbi:Alpha/Beta hydrolase protein [Pyrenochaeta sp. MPI-SDFR-AT-0127]|nr:Alpha/Beta hydrolase protein [Pyrenochaeta sp. MPI-SDFR-AT-0127]
MTSFVHPQLGKIRPIVESGTRCFYGLKPTAVSPPGGCDMELHLIQKSLKHGQFASSTTECLNLNLAMPEKISAPLPVFVFLDGGGFYIGANAWPQYDLARLVKLSYELGKPVVGVQINYRLGVYGVLYSSTLRDAGVKANRGIRDQRTALEWVRENIAGFGGDPEQVTLVGESAGGVGQLRYLFCCSWSRVVPSGPAWRLPKRYILVSTLRKTLETSVSSLQSDVDAILEAYGITASDSFDETMAKILRFVNDIQFYAPTVTLSKAWPKSSFVCHFNELNPWDGPAKGEANHILDVAFLFQNFNEYLDPTQAKTAQDFGRDFISFVNGEDSFPRHDLEKGGAKVYGGGGFVTCQKTVDYGRRPVTWELASRFGLDKLSGALDMVIAGH